MTAGLSHVTRLASVAFAGLTLAWVSPARAMEAEPAGRSETGAPSFVVLSPEALGLSTAPVDLDFMPDGRVLVASEREISMGDGVRWESLRTVDSTPPIYSAIAVDDDGQIYSGLEGGIARIERLEGNRWQFGPKIPLPPEVATADTPLLTVTGAEGQWFWHGGLGVVASWRPGQAPAVVGRGSGAIAQVFRIGPQVYVSAENSGVLSRTLPDGSLEPLQKDGRPLREFVTCAVPFGEGRALVGTRTGGLKIFNGRTFVSFGSPSALGLGTRVTDVCETSDGYFAAALDTIGIIFFDREGHLVQQLGRAMDHRLARVQHLQYSPTGVLWALLNDGVARIEFPSPISHYEPLVESNLAFSQPLRHDGNLWLLADGRAQRGVYASNGRLERFEDDSPSSRPVFTLTSVDGHLFAANEQGIYRYTSNYWELELPGIVNARLGVAPSGPDGIPYVARGEVGLIRFENGRFVAQRTPLPDLKDSYNAVIDAKGIGWIELGLSRVGRVEVSNGEATVKLIGRAEGLTEGWSELYVLDGVARVHCGKNLFRYDESTGRMVEDRELAAKFPDLVSAAGRPVTDSQGRLWYTAGGTAHLVDRTGGKNQQLPVPAIGFAPGSYTVQDDGVIWMVERRRLVRYDPKLPVAPQLPLRPLITSIVMLGSNRQVYTPGESIVPLDHDDNSLGFHFAAPANPFAAPVSFEVQLESVGTPANWVSAGNVGQVTYNRLKEGDYIFRVRPTVPGRGAGEEARVRFTVQPPWFRSRAAWVSYGVGGAFLLGLITWLSSYLPRREKERLGRLVAERTGELHATNARLEKQIQETTVKSTALVLSEDRFRQLNAQLEDRVQQRTAELSLSNEELQRRESLFRLIFEHAPVGIAWKRTDLADVYHFNSKFRAIVSLRESVLPDYAQLDSLVHPEDAPRHRELHRCIVEGGQDSGNLEERFVLLDGRLVWASLSLAVVRDREGRIVQEIAILEDISARKHSEAELAKAHRDLVDASRQAGMAEVATGVLHNVGNVLNSVNVSATVVSNTVRSSKAAQVAQLATLLAEHQSDLAGFLTNDPRGRAIPEFLTTLGQVIAGENQKVTSELAQLRKNIEHIRDIVAMQQTYARKTGVAEQITVVEMMEDAIAINSASLARRNVELVREFEAAPTVTVDKHKVIQILINLVRNAEHACDDAGRAEKRIVARITEDESSVKMTITDNGIGIPAENLTRIFNHGFTTRANGHGFGLHSGALAAREIGGSLHVHSEGRGHGASFTLEIPKQPADAKANLQSVAA